jgi:hypothetical protein
MRDMNKRLTPCDVLYDYGIAKFTAHGAELHCNGAVWRLAELGAHEEKHSLFAAQERDKYGSISETIRCPHGFGSKRYTMKNRRVSRVRRLFAEYTSTPTRGAYIGRKYIACSHGEDKQYHAQGRAAERLGYGTRTDDV